MNDEEKPAPRVSPSIDAHMGGVFDNDGNEVYAKSLLQRSAIRQAREDAVEDFVKYGFGAHPSDNHPPDCSCRKA